MSKRMTGSLAWFGVIASACLTSHLALGGATPSGADAAHLWFTPTLVAGDAKLCGQVLAGVQKTFRTDARSIDLSEDGDAGLKAVPHPFTQDYDSVDASLGVEIDPADPRRQILTDRHGAKLYVFYRTLPGCGGACESEQLVVSDAPSPGDPARFETPAAESWSLFRTAEGDHLVAAQVEGHLRVYKLASPKNLKQSCDIALAPGDMHKSADARVRSSMAAIDEFNLAVQGLSRDEGWCGSMATGSRWRSQVNAALAQVLYRPWALPLPSFNPQSENSYGDWPRIVEGLKVWSLTGPVEAAAWRHFEETLPRTSETIAQFYMQAFGWDHEKSRALAEQALTNAISRGFGFYMYAPLGGPEDAALRRALVQHRPLAEIQALALPPVAAGDGTESPLTLVIDYPEALKYLLSKGFDPDAPNGFGKTPLMYAAQTNQLEPARLLLDAGADPNARTFIPQDTCNYTLKTDGMTALHYAVRYASAALANLLLDRGAGTYSRAHSELFPGDSPLEWLQHYAGSGSGAAAGADRNPNLAATDLDALTARLRVPSDSERLGMARALVTKAEADYRAGAVKPAYRELRSSLQADGSNAKAIADLPLVALKAGEPDVALKSADNAIAILKSARERAGAWFNKGLACRYLADHRKAYQPGTSMCGEDFMQMFVTAYDLDPTPERAKALHQVFSGDGVCSIHTETTRGEIREYFGSWDQPWTLSKYTSVLPARHQLGFRVYMLHPAGQSVGEIHWIKPSRASRAPNQPASALPQTIVSYPLGSDELTIIEADMSGVEVRADLLLVGEQRCDL